MLSIWVIWKTVDGLHVIALTNPLDYAPWIALAWLVVGLVFLLWAWRTGREGWLIKAGEAAHERLETDEEAARKPAL